ncbi:uncharacterized protein LOC110907027 [Helianthus annuus]|uniref:uncharacterized protein LOC110907027 n=1 Tax=Helianthus annuus TaxID=4232 RepID=UPI000B90923E|nr:uncharacterized protein LOC110907027 [Helianthus annuus]
MALEGWMIHTRGENPPPPMPRTAEECNSLLEERISEAIVHYEVNHAEHSGATGGTGRNGHGDSSGGNLNQGYTQRFHDLSRVIPYLMTPEFKRIERYIWGLAPEIRSMVTVANPTTITQVVTLAVSLTENAVRMNNKYQHLGACHGPKCEKFGKLGHHTEDCWGKGNGGGNGNGNGNRNGNDASNGNGNGNGNGNTTSNRNGNGNGRKQGCFGCGSKEHYKKDFPKESNTQGRAFVIGARNAREDPNVVTSTFLVKNHYASILYDTGADFSFISVEFKHMLVVESSRLDIPYSIELADGKLVESGEVVKGCLLELGERRFSNDLLPVQLGSFDVVVGMDLLSKSRAEVVCHEKIIRIPLANDETLIVHREKRDTPMQIINCMKAHKCLRKGFVAFLAHVVDKKVGEPKLEDVPVVKDFPEVFPEDLPGLPP